MLVDINTLNDFGLEVPHDKSEEIDNLVANNERNYIDASLSVALSEELTEDTMDEERFERLLNSVVFDGGCMRSIGLCEGANYYIYALYLSSKYKELSDSGQSILKPENSTQINPNKDYREKYNRASLASEQCVYVIEENESDYPEYTQASGIGKIPSWL